MFGSNTKLLLIDGESKYTKDITIKDKLLGIDGSTININKIDVVDSDIYKIKQSKETSYYVDSTHLLCLKKYVENHNINITNNYSGTYLYSVSEFINNSNNFKYRHLGYRQSVEFNYQTIGIDPYFLGLWLGDGTSRTIELTSIDNEIINYIYKYAHECGLKVTTIYHPTSKANKYQLVKVKRNKTPHWLQLQFRHYGLFNNKHIPLIYIHNTKEVRLRLLAGILDTDGYKTGYSYSMNMKQNKLPYDIKYLCNSLGFKCSVTYKYKLINGNVKRYIGLYITGDTELIPVLLERRIVKNKKARINSLVNGLSIEYYGTNKAYNFCLDSDKLILLDDFTVVHN